MSFDLSSFQPDQLTRQLEDAFRSLSARSFLIVWGALIVCLLLAVLYFIAWCRIFIKANLPWERMFVPVYGDFWQYNIADCGWVFWILVACGIFAAVLPVLLRSAIPVAVLGLVILFLQLLYMRKLAAAFGRGIGFTFGLIFLHPLFILILGFGSSEFSGSLFPSRSAAHAPSKWTCSCGMVNPGIKNYCINCQQPRP